MRTNKIETYQMDSPANYPLITSMNIIIYDDVANVLDINLQKNNFIIFFLRTEYVYTGTNIEIKVTPKSPSFFQRKQL